MITYLDGDIFTSEAQIIGHGVNCKGVMGSGIAVKVRKDFPDVYHAYKEECVAGRLQGGGMFPYKSEKGTTILNIASQVKTGANAKYGLLEEGVEKAFQWCQKNEIQVFALPRIGSGIGKLEKEKVEDILLELCDKYPEIELELWTLPE